MWRGEISCRAWRTFVLVIKVLVGSGGCGSIGSNSAGTVETVALLVALFSALSTDKGSCIGDATTERTSLSRAREERFRTLACRW